MKYLLLIAFAIALSVSPAFGQTRIIRVSAGNDVAQAYSPNGFYRFPQFANAILYYKGGKQSRGAKFNYNFLAANLHFIGPKGDTMELAGVEALDSVVFEGNVFLVNEGLMEMIIAKDSLLLLKKVTIKSQTEAVGAYGMSNPTASILNLRTYSNGVGVYNLILNQDVVLTESTLWFFADKNGNFVKANKANLLKLLTAEQQTKTENYLKQNKTSFEKEADLKKLMAAIAN